MEKSKQHNYRLFLESLYVSGYSDYEDYLSSDEWKMNRQWYFTAKLPKKCLVCQSTQIELHHWIYKPIDMFQPWQVIPLCRSHHETIHEHSTIGDEKILVVLCKSFGFDRNQAIRLMQPFFRLKKSLSRKAKRTKSYHGVRQAPRPKFKKRKKNAWDRNRERLQREVADTPKKTFWEIQQANIGSNHDA